MVYAVHPVNTCTPDWSTRYEFYFVLKRSGTDSSSHLTKFVSYIKNRIMVREHASLVGQTYSNQHNQTLYEKIMVRQNTDHQFEL